MMVELLWIVHQLLLYQMQVDRLLELLVFVYPFFFVNKPDKGLHHGKENFQRLDSNNV